MSRLLTLALILGAAIAFGSVPGAADGRHPAQTSNPTADIHVDMQPGFAHVSILADPGSVYGIFDGMGLPTVEGILEDGHADLFVGTANPGPDGVVLRIRVNDEELTLTDPFWEWD